MKDAHDWSLINGKGYILNRDRSHAATSRLNVQYYLWQASLHFHIHTSISPHLPPAPAIAEVASGTCLWAINVAAEFPNARVHALDYNLEQAPPQAWLPQNVTTRHWNVFDEPPPDMLGKYDLVHTRLLLLVVENKAPGPVIRNLRKLLKPGGYLQWDELDTVNMTVKKVDPTQQTPALDQMREWSWAENRHDWTVKLADFFRDEGFEDPKAHFFGDPLELARAFNDQHLLTAEEFAEGLVKLGKPDAAKKYFEIVEKAYEESVLGAALCVPRVICTARKPL